MDGALHTAACLVGELRVPAHRAALHWRGLASFARMLMLGAGPWPAAGQSVPWKTRP